MSDPDPDHPVIHQTPTSLCQQDISSDCIFCTIATQFQPISPTDPLHKDWDPEKLDPPGYLLLSTEHVIAFLDIAPLTRGHVLVAPRKHRTKMGDMKAQEMAELGSVLPLIARSVLASVLPDIPHDEADYNIVQNNGPGAAQVIPHLHFHIVPRPPLNYRPPSTPPASNHTPQTRSPQASTFLTTTSTKPQQYPRSQPPTGPQKSYIQFGRGPRHELDDDDAVGLVQTMREKVCKEWMREFSPSRALQGVKTAKRDVGISHGIAGFTGAAEEAAGIEGSSGLISNLMRRRGGERL